MAEATVLLSGLNASPLGGVLSFQGLSIGNPNLDMVMSIVHSKRMAEDIGDHFKLMEKGYGRNKDRVIEKVRHMIDTREMKTGVVIQVTTTDPKLSSDIVNFCVSNLETMNVGLGLTIEKPLVRILDPATPPTSPSSRKIIPRVLLTFFVWVMGCTLFAFLREYLKELYRREEEEKILSGDLREKEEVLL